MKQIIKCTSLKYDKSINYEFETTLIEKTSKHLLVLGEVGRKLIHHKRGKTFTFYKPCIEYFQFEEWYTVAIEKRAENKFFYYCNIAMPPSLDDNVLSYIDLDLDVLREPDGDWQLVDEDEFIENSKKMNYPPDVITKAKEEVKKLLDTINKKQFPFDGWLIDKLEKYSDI